MGKNVWLISLLLAIIACNDEENASFDKNVSWSFVVFSDVQHGYGIYDMLVGNICKLQPTPSAAFCCGDLMMNSANELEWLYFLHYSEPIKDRMPLFIARGNHDGNDSISELMLHQFGDIHDSVFYYNYKFRDAYFIILDTQIKGEERTIQGNQLSWLKNQLELAASDTLIHNVFIFMHRPLYPQRYYKGDNLINADSLHHIFMQNKKIRAVFAGHEHAFSKYEKDEVVYIVVGSGGGALRHQCSDDYYCFINVSFYSDSKRINIKTIGIFNEIVENFDLSIANIPVK